MFRDRSRLWEADGPAGGQNHGSSGVHFARAVESGASVGGDRGRRAGLSNSRIAKYRWRERKGVGGGTPWKTKDVVASGDGDFLSRVAFVERTALRERNIDMVAPRLESSGANSGLDHRRAHDLFRIAIRLAASGIDRTERIGPSPAGA